MAEQDAPFRDFYEVINFINSANPARYKSINLLEDDRKSSNEDPSIMWSLCLNTITYAIKAFPHYKREVFRMRFYAPRDQDASACLCAEDIAKKCSISLRTVFYWLNEMREECERILIDRRIIEDANKDDKP